MADYGLAMAGGGTRGAAHVGVLSALEEAGLLPEGSRGQCRKHCRRALCSRHDNRRYEGNGAVADKTWQKHD